MILLSTGTHIMHIYAKDANIDNDEPLESIELDTTILPEGFEIIYVKKSIEHELWTGKLEPKYRGRRVFFSLGYVSKSNEQLSFNIGKLLDYDAEESRFIFQPRSDDPTFLIEVLDDNLEIRMKRQDDDGYQGLSLSYKSVNLINKLDWITLLQYAQRVSTEPDQVPGGISNES